MFKNLFIRLDFYYLEINDPDDNEFTYDVQGGPEGMEFINGIVTWIPADASDIGIHGPITLSVFDVDNPDYTVIVDYNLSIEMDPTTFLFEHDYNQIIIILKIH